MKIKLLITGLGLGLTTLVQASPTAPSWYNPAKITQVCQHKTQGTPISFAANGVLWNGTCETQFIPTKKTHLNGEDAELSSICASNPQVNTVTIKGQVYKGKCALAFAPPRPIQGS